MGGVVPAACLKDLVPGNDDQHAWVPGEPATLCGIEVTVTQSTLSAFPPNHGSSCLSCLGVAWHRFGRI